MMNARPAERGRARDRYVRADDQGMVQPAIPGGAMDLGDDALLDVAKWPQDATGPDDWIKIPYHYKVDPPEYNSFMDLGFGDVFDLDIDRVVPQHRTWDAIDGSQASSFFNYGMNKRTWKEYCAKIQVFRKTFTLRQPIVVVDSGGLHTRDQPPELDGFRHPGWSLPPVVLVGLVNDLTDLRAARPPRHVDNGMLVTTLASPDEGFKSAVLDPTKGVQPPPPSAPRPRNLAPDGTDKVRPPAAERQHRAQLEAMHALLAGMADTLAPEAHREMQEKLAEARSSGDLAGAMQRLMSVGGLTQETLKQMLADLLKSRGGDSGSDDDEGRRSRRRRRSRSPDRRRPRSPDRGRPRSPGHRRPRSPDRRGPPGGRGDFAPPRDGPPRGRDSGPPRGGPAPGGMRDPGRDGRRDRSRSRDRDRRSRERRDDRDRRGRGERDERSRRDDRREERPGGRREAHERDPRDSRGGFRGVSPPGDRPRDRERRRSRSRDRGGDRRSQGREQSARR